MFHDISKWSEGSLLVSRLKNEFSIVQTTRRLIVKLSLVKLLKIIGCNKNKSMKFMWMQKDKRPTMQSLNNYNTKWETNLFTVVHFILKLLNQWSELAWNRYVYLSDI